MIAKRRSPVKRPGAQRSPMVPTVSAETNRVDPAIPSSNPGANQTVITSKNHGAWKRGARMAPPNVTCMSIKGMMPIWCRVFLGVRMRTSQVWAKPLIHRDLCLYHIRHRVGASSYVGVEIVPQLKPARAIRIPRSASSVTFQGSQPPSASKAVVLK